MFIDESDPEFDKPLVWSTEAAVDLCRKIEGLCPATGCHVALTGGLLYKEGPRKDCDLLFYRIRQVDKINMDQLFNALASLGITEIKGTGWCYKAKYFGASLDLFFPEEQGGQYVH